MTQNGKAPNDAKIKAILDRKLELVARIHEARLGIAKANRELFKAGLSYDDIGKPCW